jgi:hypothetical protein
MGMGTNAADKGHTLPHGARLQGEHLQEEVFHMEHMWAFPATRCKHHLVTRVAPTQHND